MIGRISVTRLPPLTVGELSAPALYGWGPIFAIQGSGFVLRNGTRLPIVTAAPVRCWRPPPRPRVGASTGGRCYHPTVRDGGNDKASHHTCR